MEPHQVIKFPLSTEKSIRLMESQNQLLFSVDIAATKEDIKGAVEKLFKVKVVGVRTEIAKGNKRAYVRLSEESPAIDVATNLGLM